MLSTLPASAGLGSSAAFSVCVAAGFLSLLGAITSTHRQQSEDSCSDDKLETKQHITLPQTILDRLHSLGIQLEAGINRSWSVQELEIINMWGLEAEKLIHGTPSGIDNSISTFGITNSLIKYTYLTIVYISQVVL